MTSSPTTRLAVVAWLVFAVVVWNVVFDRMIVVAGRRYSYAAVTAVNQSGTFIRIDDWMRPATVHALWVASVAAITVAIIGLSGVAIASRRERHRQTR